MTKRASQRPLAFGALDRRGPGPCAWLLLSTLAILCGVAGRAQTEPAPPDRLTIERCEVLALANAPSWDAAVFAVGARQAAMREASAQRGPSLDIGGSAALEHGYEWQILQAETNDVFRGTLEARWPLVDFGHRRANVDQRAWEMRAAEEERRFERLKILHEARRRFFDFSAALQTLNENHRALTQINELLATLQALQANGEKSIYDIVNLRVEKGRYLRELRDAESRESSARIRLCFLLGLPAESSHPWSLADEPLRPSHFGATTSADARRVHDHPTLRADRARQEAQKRLEISRRRERFPEIAGEAAYEAMDDSRTTQSWWKAGLTAEWRIFDAGRSVQSAREAENEAARLGKLLEASERDIREEIDVALKTCDAAWTRWEESIAQARATEENLRLSRLRYQEGTSDLIELTDAHWKIKLAALERIEAMRIANQAWADWMLASGQNRPDSGGE